MMKTMSVPGFLLVVLMALGSQVGCEAAKEIIDGEEAELREQDLPNCSKIITCCENLQGRSITPGAVEEQCADTFVPAANSVIDKYQAARDVIDNDSEAVQEARDQLRDTTQATVEPGCRCFLEETIGQIDAALLPLDCEVVTDVGNLPEDLMCSDATDALLDGASSD